MSLVFRKMNIVKEDSKSHKAGVRAYVDITLNDTIEISGFTVWNGKKGLWVSPPTQKVEYESGARYFPYFKFTNNEHNEQLQEDIIKEYKKVLAGEKPAEKKAEAAY